MNMQRFPQAEQYTPKEDVTATLADGRQVQVAVKGTPIPLNYAISLGLVKDKEAADKEAAQAEKDAAKEQAAAPTAASDKGPSETKPAQPGPTSTK